jgi:hypothetical protein
MEQLLRFGSVRVASQSSGAAVTRSVSAVVCEVVRWVKALRQSRAHSGLGPVRQTMVRAWEAYNTCPLGELSLRETHLTLAVATRLELRP